MKVIFRSKDFVTVEGSGFGFNNRRPAVQAWHYLGRVQHLKWVGWYECHWEGAELAWIVHGDERLFGLAAALKSKGFVVKVKQDGEEFESHPSNDASEY
jgi:hypothetical protein